MRGRVVLGLVLAMGLFARAAADAIVLEGDYPNHLQDVWIEGNAIWWAHTDWLVKTDLSGRVLVRAQVGGHHAGLEIRNGRLYTAVCAWNGEPRGETDATCHVWIGEYDAETLARIEMHCLDINDRAGSLCILEDGSFLVGCLRHPDLSPTEVKYHHIDASYNLIRTHVVDTGRTVTLGIETIRRDGEAIYLFMGGPTVRLDARTLEVLGKFGSQGGDRGFSRDGDSAWFGKSTQRASDGRWESQLVRKTLAWTYLDAPGTVVPRAFVRIPDDRTVPVGDGTRETLNVAAIFDAWAGGTVPSPAEREAVLSQWGDYAGWRTELVATFDRAVAAGSVRFCVHPAGAATWSAYPTAEDIGSGEEVGVPLASGVVPYRSFATDLTGFGFGVRNLARENVGTALTLALRLREPVSGETHTLARTVLRLCGGRNPPWFDSRIPHYAAWPADAALAVGGAWNAGSSALAEVASVASAGVLDVSAEEPLAFDVLRPKTLGTDTLAVEVDSEMELVPSFANDLPAVDAGWKGGVLSALDGTNLNYYGLAKVGEGNAWVRLEGPPPVFNGGPVRVRVAVRSNGNGASTVSYSVDGVTYAYGGRSAIELVVPSPLTGVAFGGNGRVLSLDGLYEKGPAGLRVIAR